MQPLYHRQRFILLNRMFPVPAVFMLLKACIINCDPGNSDSGAESQTVLLQAHVAALEPMVERAKP